MHVEFMKVSIPKYLVREYSLFVLSKKEESYNIFCNFRDIPQRPKYRIQHIPRRIREESIL